MGSCSAKLADGSQVRYRAIAFSSGNYRKAYLGSYIDGVRKGQRCVVKICKSGRHRNYADDIKISELASAIAQKFNALPGVKRKVMFVKPEIAVVQTSFCLSPARPGERVLVEPYIDGKYEKFISNNGTLLFHGTLSCFCHYSFWASKQRLIIVDLQGVRGARQYFLTDPAIHSVEDSCGHGYGELDLGCVGIEAFFSTHKCEKNCRGLPKPAKSRYTFLDCEDIMKRKKGKTYVAPMDAGIFSHK